MITQGCCHDPSASTTVRERTADSRLVMHRPMTKLIRATQIFPLVLHSRGTGKTIAAAVARPTIQPKNTRGRGVLTERRCARPVAATARAAAAMAEVRGQE